MTYIKVVENGHIEYVVKQPEGESNMTKEEHDTICALLKNTPPAPDGFVNRLTEDLGWEAVPSPEEPLTEGEENEPERSDPAFGNDERRLNDDD